MLFYACFAVINGLCSPLRLFVPRTSLSLRQAAREEKGFSQSELAEKMNRRQATISDIENGKSEIGVTTLAHFALELQKPISYFFPKSLLKEWIVDIKTKFQHDMLDYAREIEIIGDKKLVTDILDVLINNFQEEFDRDDFPPDFEEEDEEEFD